MRINFYGGRDFKMIKKLLLASSTILLTSYANADSSFKKWSYVDTGDLCIAKTQAVDLELVVSISKNNELLSSVDVVIPNTDINYVTLLGQSNKSEVEELLFLQKKQDDEVTIYSTPLWNEKDLLGDLIADNTFDITLLADNSEDDNQLSFSLSGSSRILKAMVKDCLANDNFNRPYPLKDILLSSEVNYYTEITENKVLQPTLPDLDADSENVIAKSKQLFAQAEEGFTIYQSHSENKEEYTQNKNTLVAQKNKLNRLISSITELKDEKKDRARENRTLTRELTQVEDDINSDEQILPELSDDYDDAQRKYNSAKSQASEAIERMDDLNQDVVFYNNKLNGLNAESNRIDSDLSRVNNRLASAEDELRRIQRSSQIDRINEEISDLRFEKQNVVNDINRIPTVDQRLRRNSNYQQAKDRFRNVQSKKNKLEDGLRQVRSNIRNFEDRLRSVNQEIRRDQQQLNNIDSTIANLNTKKQSNNRNIRNLDQKRKEAFNKKNQLLDQYNRDCGEGHTRENERHCKGLLSQKKAQDRIINRSSDRANRLRNENNNIDQKIANNKSLKSSLPQKISQNQSKAQNIRSRISEKQSELNSSKREIDRLAKRENELSRKISNIRDRAERNYRNEKSGLESDLARINSRLRDLRSQKERVETQISRLEREVLSLEREQATLERDLSNVNAERRNVRSDLALAKNKRDEFANSSLYRNAQIKVDRAKSVLDAAESKYQVVSERLSENEDRKKSIEISINFNNERIDSIPTEIEDNLAEQEVLKEEIPVSEEKLKVSEDKYNSTKSANDKIIAAIVTTEEEIQQILSN